MTSQAHAQSRSSNRLFPICRSVCQLSKVSGNHSNMHSIMSHTCDNYLLHFVASLPKNGWGSSILCIPAVNLECYDLKLQLCSSNIQQPFWILNSNSQVNTNGIISFRSTFISFAPRMFPIIGSPLIAPFWDDVDIRSLGNIYYRQTSNATLLRRARDQLQESFPSSGNFTPSTLFIATWDRVPGFGEGSQVLI